MNAKLGGTPWAITHLPYSDKPFMLVGLSIFSKKGQKKILGMVASINHLGTRFFSKALE